MSFALNVALGRFSIPPTLLARTLERSHRVASRRVRFVMNHASCVLLLSRVVYVLKMASLLAEETAGRRHMYSAAQG